MRIALLGDTALFGKFSVRENPDVLRYLASAAAHLRGFDVVVANLETPICSHIKPRGAKSAYIRSDPANIEVLKFLGVSAVNLANNHIFDFGLEGFRSTISTLERNGIDWFGAEGRQVELESGKVALHGYCSYNTNPLGVARGRGVGVDPLNIGAAERRMRENHARGLLNILSVHSGVEHIHQPSRDDIAMARRFAAVCPYVYYGHHPHVIQGVEQIAGSLIAYSVGNFCFDDVYTDKSPSPLVKQSRQNKTGLILELEIEEGRLIGHGLTTVFADSEEMVVATGVGAAEVVAYSEMLSLPEREYAGLRQAEIESIDRAWRSRRDWNWYAARLNWRTVDMVLRARNNRRLYRKNVLKFLQEV